MSTENTNTNTNTKPSNRPTHNLAKKVRYGKNSDFENLGVAWARDDGGFYCKFYGTQIIEGGFYAFPVKDEDNQEGGQ